MEYKLKIHSILDNKFKNYGRIIYDFECSTLIEKVENIAQVDSVVYVPSVQDLEDSDSIDAMQNSLFDGMPIQIGYCYGNNYKLNALEYHRNSEINIAVTAFILLLGLKWDLEDDFTYDTKNIEAFLIPKGTIVEIYATTLHYAPCNFNDTGFISIVILPKGTNTKLETNIINTSEDRLQFAKNKWLIAHAESGLDKEGAFIGLKGDNIDIHSQ